MLTRGAMRGLAAAALLAGALLPAFGGPAAAGEDGVQTAAADLSGEPLVGVGLVIGLPGTGDSTVDAAFVDASIVGVLKRAGLEPWRGEIEAGRVAMVMLSAVLPRGAGDGADIEVSVQAIGNAASLAGGTLLAAPLRDAAGAIVGAGQGPLVARSGASNGAILQVAIKDRPPGRDYAALQ